MQPQQPAGFGPGAGSLAQFGQPHAEQHWYHPQQQNYQQFQQAMQAGQQRWGQPQGIGTPAGIGGGMGQPGAAFGGGYGQAQPGWIPAGPARQMFQPLPGEQHPQAQNYQQYQAARQAGFGPQPPGQPQTQPFGPPPAYGQPQPGWTPGPGR